LAGNDSVIRRAKNQDQISDRSFYSSMYFAPWSQTAKYIRLFMNG